MKATQYLDVGNNIELYIETYGNPNHEAVIFISGAGANSSFWSEALCERLVQNKFFVIKYDHRDFGYSTKIDWDKNPYGFKDLVLDPIKILDAFKIQKAHAIGHSMGGFIVQTMAINYADRVISISSISSSTNSESVPPPPEKTWEIYMSSLPIGDYNKDLPGFMKVWDYLNGTAPFDEELAIDYTKNLYERQVVDGALGASHVKVQSELYDRTSDLNTIQIPALVMHGEEDYAVNKYAAIQTADAIPKAKLVIIPKMGHLPFNFEIKERFNNEIFTFLRAHKLGEY